MENTLRDETESSPTPAPTTRWGVALVPAVCERCDWSYLAPPGGQAQRCPHCFEAPLIPLDEQPYQELEHYPPELFLPFSLSGETIAQKILAFASGIRFAPGDLNPENLVSRLQQVHLPMWLVDADVEATWQAETGFDYQVVSHQGRYSDHEGWVGEEVTESRIRWEPRLGRLSRTYSNITAPAMEDADKLRRRLGEHNMKTAQPYQPEATAEAFIRLPNRSPEDAWPSAIPALQAAAAEECRQAASADHLRQFRWSPEYSNKTWSLLLLPVYTTYYLDDEGHPNNMMINGQTGRVYGVRRASMKRAQRTALYIGLVALVFFLISLIATPAALVLPVLLPIGVIAILAAILTGLGATIPLLIAWQFNRAQARETG